MRITGGKARGIILDVPQTQTFLRPSTDGLREAIFSSLGRVVEHASILDVFAGVGSYGLEALSRGAECCAFIEKNIHAIRSIEVNIKNVGKSCNRQLATKLLNQDAFGIYLNNNIFDFIFIDPPYNLLESRCDEILTKFMKNLSRQPFARLIIEVPAHFKIKQNEHLIQEKRLGKIGKSRQPNIIVFSQKLSTLLN